MVLGEICSNKALVGCGFGSFSLESKSVWYIVIKSKYGLCSNLWDAQDSVRVTHDCP